MLSVMLDTYFSIKGFLKLSFLSLLVVLVNGCQATGEKYEEVQSEANKSMIYIYRPNIGIKGKASEYPEVFINDTSLGVLRAKGYMKQELPVGQHEIRITGLTDKANWSFRDIKHTVNVKHESQNYFRLMVRFDPESNNRLLEPGEHYLVFLTPVEPGDAIYEIRNTKFSE